MLDGVLLRMVEDATHAGYPMDAAAVLLIELEGLREVVEEQVDHIRQAATSCGAREVRLAKSAEERELLWKGRKNAFGAVGRVSPFYYVQDGVVPRTKIATTLRFIGEVGKKYGLIISNIFHAGDGNMHPIILFDARKTGDLEKTKAAGEEILQFCISVGGSITGEHGVGMEKNEMMGRLFSTETLDMIRNFMLLFDPDNRLNPDKVLPTGKGCLEIRQPAPQPRHPGVLSEDPRMFGMDKTKTQEKELRAPDSLPPDVIVSSTRQAQRVPPGQSRTLKWPVLDGQAGRPRSRWSAGSFRWAARWGGLLGGTGRNSRNYRV